MTRRIIPFVLLLLLLGMQACNDKPAEVEDPARPVKTVVVKIGDKGREWAFAGTAEDALATDLSFRVAGKILEFPGDQVGRKFLKNEIIASLDPEDYELQLREATANMEQVRARYVRARADMGRNLELYERSVISKGELDQIEAEFKSYQAQLAATAKQLDIAGKQLEYTVLRAPFTGWIGQVHTRVQNNVAAGQAVVSFNAGRQMKMIVAIPDRLIAQVSEGDDVVVVFDALPDRQMHGKVMEVGVDSTAGSAYPVKIYLDNDKQLVRSGMTGNVIFVAKGESVGAAYLPPVAVFSRTDGTRAVWVIDPETSTVSSHTVTVGQLTAMGVEILDGVQAGDVVVTHGVHHLEEGHKVRFTQTDTEG